MWLSPVTGQTPPAGPCFSRDQSFNYQANAFSRGLDITGTVGPFTWQSVNVDVTTLAIATDSAPVAGLVTGQVKVTAHTPGITSLVASNGNVNSQPLDFTTCAVQSITLAVTGSTTNSINVTSGNGKTVTATVVDTLGNTITGVPLTWSSSNPLSVSATSRLRGHSASRRRDRGCFLHSAHLQYWIEAAASDLSGGRRRCGGAPASTTTTTTTTPTVYVSSTGFSTSPAGNCATTVGCVSLLVPIGSPNNTVGAAVGLPATPNSLVFDRQGAKAYMGTDFSFFGSRGLMQITVASPPTVAQFKSVTGKVLTVSPDGKKVILSGADPNAVPVPGSNTPPPCHSGDRVRHHQQYQYDA